MPDKEENTNETPQEETPKEEPKEEVATEEQATPEEPKGEVEEPETPEEPKEEPSEDINLEEYSRERYKPAPQNESTGEVDEVAKELSNLPTDEYGNANPEEVAKWFTQKLSEASTQAERRAAETATQIVASNLSEVSQQQELLQKHPDVRKDKELLDTVFDLRDAATLRGQDLTLAQAANKLEKMRQAGRSEGAKDATRTTETLAAAHLETASTKGANVNETQQLARQAFEGRGDEAKNARRALLKQHIDKEIKAGRIKP